VVCGWRHISMGVVVNIQVHHFGFYLLYAADEVIPIHFLCISAGCLVRRSGQTPTAFLRPNTLNLFYVYVLFWGTPPLGTSQLAHISKLLIFRSKLSGHLPVSAHDMYHSIYSCSLPFGDVGEGLFGCHLPSFVSQGRRATWTGLTLILVPGSPTGMEATPVHGICAPSALSVQLDRVPELRLQGIGGYCYRWVMLSIVVLPLFLGVSYFL
jgi:hypothetical protein